jgi:hypothetical protein
MIWWLIWWCLNLLAVSTAFCSTYDQHKSTSYSSTPFDISSVWYYSAC